MRKTCYVIKKEYDKWFLSTKLEKINRERKCCANVLNEGEYDFYIQGSGLVIYDLGLGSEFEALDFLT